MHPDPISDPGRESADRAMNEIAEKIPDPRIRIGRGEQEVGQVVQTVFSPGRSW